MKNIKLTSEEVELLKKLIKRNAEIENELLDPKDNLEPFKGESWRKGYMAGRSEMLDETLYQIDRYFAGLISIPDPQKTRDSLKDFISLEDK